MVRFKIKVTLVGGNIFEQRQTHDPAKGEVPTEQDLAKQFAGLVGNGVPLVFADGRSTTMIPADKVLLIEVMKLAS